MMEIDKVTIQFCIVYHGYLTGRMAQSAFICGRKYTNPNNLSINLNVSQNSVKLFCSCSFF